MIRAGRVTLNGQVAQLGNRVFEGDIVLVDSQPLSNKPTPFYIALNKPVGIVCTTDMSEPNNIISHINHEKRLFPIGRLDKPSQGLILLTNDGDIVNKILRAGNNHEKEYIVTTRQKVTHRFVQQMSRGIPILGTRTKRCKVIQLSPFTFKIILTQGLNRQIRRMCEYLDYEVLQLKRTRIMNITLNGLKEGEWRDLNESEVQEILSLVSKSSKTEEASKYTRNQNS